MAVLAAATDIGKNKEKNQDSFYTTEYVGCNGEDRVQFAILCDGMGGYADGSIASSTLIKTFAEWGMNFFDDYKIEDIDLRAVIEQWTAILRAHNTKLIQYGSERGIKCGTTAVAVLIIRDHFLAMNVGDSRCYIIDENRVVQLTHDQSLVQREVDNGNITPEQARKHPKRNVLIQCIGIGETVNPFYSEGSFDENATFLLCSDGFYHELEHSEMIGFLAPGNIDGKPELDDALGSMVELVRMRGERDDVTAVAISMN